MKQELVPQNKIPDRKNRALEILQMLLKNLLVFLKHTLGSYYCRLLDWTGCYNFSISKRLWGHYRLYRYFKAHYEWFSKELPASSAYILYYRSKADMKYFISRIMSIPLINSWYQSNAVIRVAQINRSLAKENSDILLEFLNEAGENYEAAHAKALDRIKSPVFPIRMENRHMEGSPPKIIQFNQENNHQTTNNHQYNTFTHTEVHTDVHHEVYKEFHTQSIVREGVKGKEKGVFSKKQILILFDLLGEDSKLEKIDFSRSNKFGDIAGLLHALTGRGRDTFIEELHNARSRGLYTFNTQGELTQLLSTLINLGDICRKAGQKSIAKLVDKKIMELEAKKKNSLK